MMKQSHLTAAIISLAATALVLILTPQSAIAVVTEDLKLVPNDSSPGDEFGESVAVSGGWAVVGSPGSGAGGAVYIFNTVTGQEIIKLVPTDLTAGASFGHSIAVDGNLAVIGAPTQDIGGAVYVFDITTGNQIGKLVSAGVSASDFFGLSVAISGNTVLIGAPGDDDVFNISGSAYLFDITTGSRLMKFNADAPEEFASFGESVAFDGGLVAAYDRGSQPSVMLFDPLTGDQLADIPAPDHTLAGSAVAISGDRLLVGAPSVFTGAISGIYDIADLNNITELKIPWPGVSGGAFFGDSVALNDVVALISTWSAGDISFSGIVHMFDPDTGNLLESFRSSDASVDDQFGWSIGLDGQTLIVGARGFEPTDSGAAYLFTIPEPGTFVCFAAGLLALLRTRGHIHQS